jgi:putative membrane protein insertion efficiency factor
MTIEQRAALLVIRTYQLVLSPFAGGACRFEPSCSTYAAEAIERHGAARGLWLALRRFSRCHPFSSAGWDPVPEANATRSGRNTLLRASHGSEPARTERGITGPRERAPASARSATARRSPN